MVFPLYIYGQTRLHYAARLRARVTMLCSIACVHSVTTGSIIITPHAQRERGKVIGHGVHIYIAYYTSKNGIRLVISRVASYFHEPKASANTAYE